MPKMTIRGCMDAALQLINQYSIAGALVPLSYNDQADDENRMVNLINDAQMEIATTVRPIYEALEITVPAITANVPTADISTQMPEDFFHAAAVYFTPAGGRRQTMVDANNYKWLGDNTLLVPNRPAGTYRVEYTRYPVRYDSTTDRATTLDNTPDTHEIIPYFVAAMLSVEDNPKAYYANYNVWETRLARLGHKPAHAVNTQVFDVYGFDNFRGLW